MKLGGRLELDSRCSRATMKLARQYLQLPFLRTHDRGISYAYARRRRLVESPVTLRS